MNKIQFDYFIYKQYLQNLYFKNVETTLSNKEARKKQNKNNT